MREELLKILKMVEEGKIKAEEGLKLIESVIEVHNKHEGKKSFKNFVIKIDDSGGDRINIKLPVNLVKYLFKFGIKLKGLNIVKSKLKDKGIDLDEIDTKELEEIFDEFQGEMFVDIEDEDGSKVKIYVE
ncbi:hypothetical protein DRN73_09365 [Candidatus Pacearchaeota archaeon]|nr:MAG: hypothetical protein DRN73_09365 [Candidatus Pacearchaeota archaeon]